MVAKSAEQAYKQGMQSWQNQIIKSGNTVSGTTTSGVPAAGTNPVAVELYNMTDAQRLQIAQTLKNAGYRVPVTGKFNDQLVAQWSNVTMAAQVQAQSIGQPFDKNYLTGYLQQQQIANAAMGGDGATKIKKYVDTTVSNETQATALINAVLKDTVGRGATAAEIKKYTSALQKAQKAAPQVTNIGGTGSTQTRTTTGGIDPTQFLIQQVAGTDEAKANKVLQYYDVFKNAIGVK